MCRQLSYQSYTSYIEVTCLVQPGRRPPYSLCTPFASSTTTPKPKIFYYTTPSPDYLSGSLPPTPSACNPPCPPSPALWPPAVWTPGRLYFQLESCALRFHISGLGLPPVANGARSSNASPAPNVGTLASSLPPVPVLPDMSNCPKQATPPTIPPK